MSERRQNREHGKCRNIPEHTQKNNKTGKKAEKNRNYNINSIFYKLVRGKNYFTLESPSIINASFLLLFLYKIRLLSTSEKRHGK